MIKLNSRVNISKKAKFFLLFQILYLVSKQTYKLKQLLALYYLITQEKYLKEENIWKLLSTVQKLKKLINFFYKKYLENLTASFSPINSALLMIRLIIKPTRPIKRK